MESQILMKGDGRRLHLGPVRMTIKEDGSGTRGRLAIAEFEIAPRSPAPPAHIHWAHEEGFYVLQGGLEFTVGTSKMDVPEGGFVMATIGVPHTFRNCGDNPARFLNTFTPPQYLGYFEELSERIIAGGIPDVNWLKGVMARYQTEIVGPSLGRSTF